MSLDPNNLTPNKINLGSRISKPLRSVMSTGKRLMSNGMFIKSMRSALAVNKNDGITDKVAKKMALRLAVGVKDFAPTFKKEKTFFGKMKEKGMLSSMYKYSVKNAITHYKTLAGATVAPNNKKIGGVNDGIEKPTSEQVEADHEEHLDQHHRMQEIRNDIEKQKHEKQEHEVSVTKNYGQEDTKSALTSISHLNDHSNTSASQTPFPSPSVHTATPNPFVGSIDEPKNTLSAEDLVQNAPPTQLD